MAVWDGTKYHVTPDGANDLLLDEGAADGFFEKTSIDVGSLAVWSFDCRFRIEQDGAGRDREAWVRLYIATSEDDITYTSYMPFKPFTRYFRYYNVKIKFWSHPNTAYRPKVTAFEPIVKRAAGKSRQETVKSILAAAPGNPALGDRHLITAGGDANKIITCVDSDTPTWQKDPLISGMHVWDEATEENVIYSTKQEYPYCLRGFKPLGYDKDIACNGALTTIVSVTTAAGDFVEDEDGFFVEIVFYTGAPPAVGDQCIIQINDSVGGWTTVWTAPVFGPGIYPNCKVFIRKCATANTACIASDCATQIGTRTAGLAANWWNNFTGIRVRCMGDAGAKGSAYIWYLRQP